MLSRKEVDEIKPQDVHKILGDLMLIKGYALVFDTEKSHGSYIVDSLTDKEFLDMFTFYASWPISHNHPSLREASFMKKISNVSIHNPSNPDIYTIEQAQFVSTFKRVCMPPEFKHLFLIAGGTLAVENALKVAFDWKVRKNILKGKTDREYGHKVLHFRNAFHGRSGYSLSLTNTDPAKYQYFPMFPWPRVDYPATNVYGENIDEKEKEVISEIRSILEKRLMISHA